MTRTSYPVITRGTQVGPPIYPNGKAQVGPASFAIQGSAMKLQQRQTRSGDSEGPGTPASTIGKKGFSFRPQSRSGNVDTQARQHQTQKHSQPPNQEPRAAPKAFAEPEHPEEQEQNDVPIVPTWEGGNLRAPRTPQRPGSAASARGLCRSASVPNVQRPSSAPEVPSNAEIAVEVKKDPAKWYIPANTYKTQYMQDYSEVTVENTNGVPRARTAVEIRAEFEKKNAERLMNRRPSTPTMKDLTAYMYTSETAAQFRKFTEKEVSDCRGTFCDWQTNNAEQKRTDQLKEDLSALRESREVRKEQRKEEARRVHRRPPKVPLKQDTETRPPSASSVRRPKSLADLLNMQKGQPPVPNGNVKPDEDAMSNATTTSAHSKESFSEVGSLDSARTDSSSRTVASSVCSSRSSASCRSSRSSASTRSSSSSRSSASLRSTSSKRSSSSSRSSGSSRTQSLKNLDKVSTGSVCGSSLNSERPSTAASESYATSAATLTNRSGKIDSSTGMDSGGAAADRLQLDSKVDHHRPDIPSLDLLKKSGEPIDEPKYQSSQPHTPHPASVSNITVFSRHIG